MQEPMDYNKLLKMKGYEGILDFNKIQEINSEINLLPEKQKKEVLDSMKSHFSKMVNERKSEIESNLAYKCFIESHENMYKDIPKEKQIEELKESIKSEESIKEYFGNIIKNMNSYDSENKKELVKQAVGNFINKSKIT